MLKYASPTMRSTMIIASIDPGETTGLVIVQTRGHSILRVSSLRSVESVWKTLLASKIEHLIVESSPVGAQTKYADDYTYESARLRSRIVGFSIQFISPSTWKPVARGYGIKSPDKCKNQHERDAFRMLAYWMVLQKLDWREYV